jgi:hypothetical protein
VIEGMNGIELDNGRVPEVEFTRRARRVGRLARRWRASEETVRAGARSAAGNVRSYAPSFTDAADIRPRDGQGRAPAARAPVQCRYRRVSRSLHPHSWRARRSAGRAHCLRRAVRSRSCTAYDGRRLGQPIRGVLTPF